MDKETSFGKKLILKLGLGWPFFIASREANDSVMPLTCLDGLDFAFFFSAAASFLFLRFEIKVADRFSETLSGSVK